MTKIKFIATAAVALVLGCASGSKQNAKQQVDEPKPRPVAADSDSSRQSETRKTPVAEPVNAPDVSTKPSADPSSDEAMGFAFDFFRQLAKKEGNLFFSPLSLSTALAMTYGGARGETEKQMAGALGFPLPQDELHRKMLDIQTGLNNLKGVELSVANSLWPAKEFPFKKEFLNLAKDNYFALITALDYVKNPEKARLTINKWVSKQTKKKIEKLIDPGFIDALTTLVLTNAVYFKGDWSHPFDAKNTTVMPFAVSSDKTVDAQMMSRTMQLKLYEDEEIKVLELPYAGGEVSMFAILPNNADSLTQIESEIDAAKLNDWLEKSRSGQVHVILPKFKIQSSFELKKELSALGMTDAFDALKADFSGMADAKNVKGLFISAVLHKAVVDVNEEGTEAAAATAVVMKRSMPQRFTADHPFLFLIRDAKTKSIIFLGRMANPVAN